MLKSQLIADTAIALGHGYSTLIMNYGSIGNLIYICADGVCCGPYEFVHIISYLSV